jgi:hypothetical protein
MATTGSINADETRTYYHRYASSDPGSRTPGRATVVRGEDPTRWPTARIGGPALCTTSLASPWLRFSRGTSMWWRTTLCLQRCTGGHLRHRGADGASRISRRFRSTGKDHPGCRRHTRTVPNAAHGAGIRWRARYIGPDGNESSTLVCGWRCRGTRPSSSLSPQLSSAHTRQQRPLAVAS